jgi:hypothetical protein
MSREMNRLKRGKTQEGQATRVAIFGTSSTNLLKHQEIKKQLIIENPEMKGKE